MTGPILFRIDEPEDYVLRDQISRVRGWCACLEPNEIQQLGWMISDAPIPWQDQERDDVNAQNPTSWVRGFTLRLDLSQYLFAVRSNELELTISFSPGHQRQLLFSLAPGLMEECLTATSGV
jgi:hypothetical protein